MNRNNIYAAEEQFPVPFYVLVFDILQEYTKLPRLVLYIIVSLIPYFLYFPLADIFGWTRDGYTDYWIRLNFSGWALGSFLFMNYIYAKSKTLFPVFIYLCGNPYNRYLLYREYKNIFKSRGQLIITIGVAVLTTVTGVVMNMGLPYEPKFYITINSFIVGLIIGPGLWYSIGLGKMIQAVGNMQNLKVNSFNPYFSIGIGELPNLSSIWSFCFFGEAILVYVGLVFPNWQGSESIVGGIQIFWLLIFLGVALFNLINPMSAIAKITGDAKTKLRLTVSEKIFNRIGKLETDDDSFINETNNIYALQETYEKITNAKTSTLELPVILRFLAATISTLIIIFIEHLDKLLTFFDIKL